MITDSLVRATVFFFFTLVTAERLQRDMAEDLEEKEPSQGRGATA